MAIGRVSDIDLRWLHVFIKVVQCGGYSAAQADLNIGLATISAHMKSLEDRLGVQLCRRGRAGFQLTEEGQIIYEEALLLHNSLDRFTAVSHTLGSELAGRIDIGLADATTNSGSTLVSDAIQRFNQQENRVRIHLHINSRAELEKHVLDGKYDLAIGNFATHYSGLDSYPMYGEPHGLFVGKGNELWGESSAVSKKQLSQQRISDRGYAAGDDCESLGSLNRAAVASNLEAQLTLLLSGSYVGYMPVGYAQPWIERGRLFRLNAPDFEYDSQHFLITRQKSSLTKQAALLIKAILELDQ